MLAVEAGGAAVPVRPRGDAGRPAASETLRLLGFQDADVHPGPQRGAGGGRMSSQLTSAADNAFDSISLPF